VIVIVDYGLGNVGSIQNMLVRCGASVTISGDPAVVRGAQKLVLPGVGSFDTGMRELRASGLVDALQERVMDAGVPILGICLGMHMLGLRSEEGEHVGLGWLDVETARFVPAAGEKVPHMAWTEVQPRAEHPLFEGLGDAPLFYFSHSYYAVPKAKSTVIAGTTYGITFASAIQQGNVLGVQFHPEKSHRTGVQLLRNFAEQV
jgi:glutamine amidotransferase